MSSLKNMSSRCWTSDMKDPSLCQRAKPLWCSNRENVFAGVWIWVTREACAKKQEELFFVLFFLM